MAAGLSRTVFLLSLYETLILIIQGKQPNIIFILTDDHGWNDVGYHGSEISTPNLDYLAKTGVQLENYYVQPTCTPSRSQLLTGRYQIHTGMQHLSIFPAQPNGLPLRFPTMADQLKKAGYSTHLIGKWHLGFYRKEFTPTYRGFDTFYGKLTGSGDHFEHERCHSFEGPDGLEKFCGLDLWDNETPIWNATGRYSTELFTERALRVINNHDNSKPLFMLLAFQAPHIPLQVPKKYVRPYFDIEDRKRRLYAGMIASLDEAVGAIYDALWRKYLYQNSVIVFSTDNGGSGYQGASNWPLRGGKGTFWEGGVRGVGFVNSPLIEKPARESRGLMHISDWFPTLVTLGGGAVKGIGKLDGFDMWGAISRGEHSPRKEILHNIDPLKKPFGTSKFKNTFDTSMRAAIRVGDMKLITGDPGKSSWIPPAHLGHLTDVLFYRPPRNKNVWLFNITDDPVEELDLTDEYPRYVKQLLWKLKKYYENSIPPRFPRGDVMANPVYQDGVWGPWIVKKNVKFPRKYVLSSKKRKETVSVFERAWNSFYDSAMNFATRKLKQKLEKIFRDTIEGSGETSYGEKVFNPVHII